MRKRNRANELRWNRETSSRQAIGLPYLLLRRAGEDLADEWLAWELFVAHGGEIDKGGHNDGRLLHVVLLQAVEDVHRGVMRAGVVFQLVLNELKTGQAYGVERE